MQLEEFCRHYRCWWGSFVWTRYIFGYFSYRKASSQRPTSFWKSFKHHKAVQTELQVSSLKIKIIKIGLWLFLIFWTVNWLPSSKAWKCATQILLLSLMFSLPILMWWLSPQIQLFVSRDPYNLRHILNCFKFCLSFSICCNSDEHEKCPETFWEIGEIEWNDQYLVCSLKGIQICRRLLLIFLFYFKKIKMKHVQIKFISNLVCVVVFYYWKNSFHT